MSDRPGHRHICQRASLIDQRQTFGALLRDQPGCVTQAGRHGATLVDKIGPGLRVQCVGIDYRIVEQPACQLAAQNGASALIAVSHMFVDKGM